MVPLSLGFEPADLRGEQREYVDVLLLTQDRPWRIPTFEDADSDPGFSPELDRAHEGALDLAVFTDDTETVDQSVAAAARENGEEVQLQLR